MANRSDKRHDYLSLRDRRAIENATEFARNIDLPLTMAVTVHWAYAGGPCAGNWRAKFSYLILLCKRWMQARDVIWAATAVHEQGSSKELPHTHFAIHVPARLFAPFETELKRLAAGYVESVVAVRPIKPPLGAMGWARYQTKAIHPRYLDTVSPSVRKVDRDKVQGPIFGRRIYISGRSIGKVAQTQYWAGLVKPPALTGNTETNQRIMERWKRRRGAA
jgi:hypothetical protein